MTMRRVVPNLQSEHLDESQDLYVNLLGFEVAMNLGWIITLAAPGNPTAQLSLLRHDATAAVHPHLSIGVTDVDAVYAKAVARGLQIVHPLTDEPWGVRRFFVEAPNGVVIHIVEHRDRATS
jgi:catechol 2,3-dioxygenase-like lactoylglutathione lyase family enzyme